MQNQEATKEKVAIGQVHFSVHTFRFSLYFAFCRFFHANYVCAFIIETFGEKNLLNLEIKPFLISKSRNA